MTRPVRESANRHLVTLAVLVLAVVALVILASWPGS